MDDIVKKCLKCRFSHVSDDTDKIYCKNFYSTMYITDYNDNVNKTYHTIQEMRVGRKSSSEDGICGLKARLFESRERYKNKQENIYAWLIPAILLILLLGSCGTLVFMN